MSADVPMSAEAQSDTFAAPAARLNHAVSRRDAVEARLAVLERKLAEEEESGDQGQLAKRKIAVVETHAALKEAELAVANTHLRVMKRGRTKARKPSDKAAVTNNENEVTEAAIAVEMAKVKVEEAKVAVAEAKIAVTGPDEKVTARIAVLEAKIAVAEAKVNAAKARVAVAGPDTKEAESAMLHAASQGLTVAQDVHARAAHADPGVGQKRLYEEMLGKVEESVENALKARGENLSTVCLSDINHEHITAAISWHELEEDYVQIAESGPQTPPFAWDATRTELAQEDEYLQYLRTICSVPQLQWTLITGSTTHLCAHLGPFKVSGTADIALVTVQAVRCKSFQTDRKATYLIAQVKKKIFEPEVCQAKGELLADAILQGSNGHALVMLSDLCDDWYFFWVAAQKLHTLRCGRPAAVGLLNALFGDGPLDLVPPEMRQRSGIGNPALGHHRKQRESAENTGEQDLENFDMDGSLSAADILQVKLDNSVRELVTAKQAWACMFSQ